MRATILETILSGSPQEIKNMCVSLKSDDGETNENLFLPFSYTIFLQHFNNGRIESAEVNRIETRSSRKIIRLGSVSMSEKILLGSSSRSRSLRSASTLSVVSTGSTGKGNLYLYALLNTSFQLVGAEASIDFYRFMYVFDILERGNSHQKICCKSVSISH